MAEQKKLRTWQAYAGPRLAPAVEAGLVVERPLLVSLDGTEEYHTDQRLLLMPGPHRLEVLLDPRRGFWMFSRTPVLSLHAGPGRHYRLMHELAKEKAPKGALSFLFDDGRRSASFWIAEEDAPPADRSGSVER